jgi:predicted MFS family arabinose efflux permease
MQLHVVFQSIQRISMKRFAVTSLMIGNIVTGVSVLAPAGMLPQLSDGLGVTIRDAGLLITFGAIVLCIASPATAWLTSRFDRRPLLAGTMLFTSLTHVASAFAPDYRTLLGLRLVMLAVVALFTPQAASLASTMVPPERRGSTMTYVFLGWSLAAAAGLPTVTYLASHFGWRMAYAGIALIAFLAFVLTAWRLPRGIVGVRVDLKTWGALGSNPLVLMLLLITMMQMGSQFIIFTFMGPLVQHHAGAGPEAVALLFAIYGVMGFIGNVLASRVVDTWGAWKTSLAFSFSILAGIAGWALGSGVLPAMIVAMVLWGFGFAAANSMQQVRLMAAAPTLASASVSLNTSVLYIGQGLGSALGAVFYAREAYDAMNLAGTVAIGLTVLLIVLTRPRTGIN